MRIYLGNMINLEQFYFQGEVGLHHELIYKLRRCGFSVRYRLNSRNLFYFISDESIQTAPIDPLFVDIRVENKTRVDFKEYEAIVDTYIQERITNGDWWLELQKGDEVEVLDMFPTDSYYRPEYLKNRGKTVKIDNITPLIISKTSLITKTYGFNGDCSAYVILGQGVSYFSWLFVPKNTTPIEKIALSSIVLPKIIL